MATKVAGELYESLTGQLFEIGRQIRQANGYPFNPEDLQKHLQDAIEGRFFGGQMKLILSKPFNHTEFIGKDWTIEEEDPRSVALKEIEVDKFLFETCISEGENRITGEEKLRRLKEKTDFIPFGASIFLALWEDYKANKKKSILEWLFLNKEGVRFMDFFGTVFRSPDGSRLVLYLYRGAGGGWDWYCSWLGYDWNVRYPSVGCASPLAIES